jgi:hypothetical protein
MFLLQVQKAGGLLGVTSRGLLILDVLLLIILLMFIIIIVLAALWPRTKAQEAPRVCDTPACLRAAAQVGKSNQLNSDLIPIFRVSIFVIVSLR